MRILIIEDDKDTADYIRERLEEKCFAVDHCEDAVLAVRTAKSTDYDAILLDYALPSKDGISVAKEIRSYDHPTRSNVPIIMISVTPDVENKITALEHGIDDYITKPFFFGELFARLQAVLRRPQQLAPTTYSLDDLVLDVDKQKVTRDNRSVYLTKKEFALLEYLMKNKGTVVSRSSITEHVWDMNIDPFSNTIEMHILNLRKKLDISKKPLIHSIPGRGYKIDSEK